MMDKRSDFPADHSQIESHAIPPIRSDFSSCVCCFHLPEYCVGIAAGINHTGRAKICGDNCSAAFRQQFKAGAIFAEGLFAPRAGRPEFFVPAVRAKLVHNTTINHRPLKNGFAACEPFFSGYAKPSIHFPAIGIDFFIVGASQAKGLGVHVATAVSPHVEFPAIHTQGRLATVAQHDGRFLMTSSAYLASIRNNHLENSPQ
jgi:hypothetical protein